jgi:hypothetical protein
MCEYTLVSCLRASRRRQHRRVQQPHGYSYPQYSEGPLHSDRMADSGPVCSLNTHKKNERWLKSHPKVRFHFTPTRASWLNQIETWFSILQGQSLSGASFTAVHELQQHIDTFISTWNEKAEPFVWTKKKARQRRFKGRRITQL